jgi:hypothetical protein
VKSLAALSLIVFCAVTGQAFAEDALPQPLTRADCEAASGWSWSETANVCEFLTQQAVPATPQPLTRADCDLAGMSWNGSALVCEEKSEGSAQKSEPKEKQVAHTILINIDKSKPHMMANATCRFELLCALHGISGGKRRSAEGYEQRGA